MTDTMCKNCGKPIHYAYGRGTKPSGPAWRHCNSGQVVCPGTFRATPPERNPGNFVYVPPDILVPLREVSEAKGNTTAMSVRAALVLYITHSGFLDKLALADNVLVKHPTEEDLHG